MSSPSTQAMQSKSPSASISSTLKDELSDDENLANTRSIKKPTIAAPEEDERPSPDEQNDIQLGIATLVPLRRAPVKWVIVPPRILGQTALPVRSQSQRKLPRVPPRPKRKAKTALVSERATTPHPVGVKEEVGGRGKEEEQPLPRPSLVKLPPPIPPRRKRKPKIAPVNTSPQPLPTQPVPARSVMLPPLPSPSINGAATPPPFPSTPPLIPEATRRALDQPEKRVGVVFAPVAQRDSRAALLGSVICSAAVDGGGGVEGEGEDEISESSDWNTQLMRRMYSDCLAGRGKFSAERLKLEALKNDLETGGDEAEEEAEAETKKVSEKQGEFFDLADDGEGFWDPFVEMGISDGEVEEVLGMGVSPKTKVKGKMDGRRTSEGSMRQALGDESLHGLTPSPKIVGRDMVVGRAGAEGAATFAIVGPPADEVLPEKEGGGFDYMFNGWSSFSSDNRNAEDDGEFGDQEIVNPFADQFAVQGKEWAAFLDGRRESGPSDYSAPSRLASPVPQMRGGDTLFYSPIQNPWVSAIDSVNDSSRSLEAVVDFFSGFDVEALVASMQEPGYELGETDSGKGSPEQFHLKPHKPKKSCGCEFCCRHYHPTLETLKAHNLNEWCHCSACGNFRDNSNMEKNRAEQNAAWKARLDELAAEVDDGRAEEESRLHALLGFKEEDNQEELKPKKVHRLGNWVGRHLRSPSLKE